jgi:hypothetical protein
MNPTHRALLLIVLGLSVVACAPTHKILTLRADNRLLGGGEAVAKIEAPGDWYQATRKADRADLAAPDNFSSVSFSVAAVLADRSRCPEFARRAATDATSAASNAGAKPEFASAPEAPEVVDWKVTIQASPPGPFNRFVQGRAMCREGALAIVTCSTGVERKSSTGADCAKVLESLNIEGLNAAPAAAPAPAVAPAPAPASTDAPAK